MNPKGKALDRDTVARLVERYQFLKYPATYEDFNSQDGSGVLFGMGTLSGGVAVMEMRLFQDGFFLWTGESTDQAEAMFSDVIKLMVGLGYEFRPEFVTDISYVSELVVRSDVDLARYLVSPVASLVEKAFPGRHTEFTTMGFSVGENRELDALRIERVPDVSPKNEYWTRATLATANHFQLLQDLERLLA